MNIRAQRVCIWSGAVLIGLFGIGFAGLAGFLVPPSPRDSPEEIKEMFAEDRNSIRVGLLISLFSAAMLVPWAAGMSVQLRRATGRHSPLPQVVALSGAVFSLEFIYLIMFWQVAAFREDASADSIRTLNDMAWIPFVGISSTTFVMALSLGAAMLSDHRDHPVFPRWAGYFNIWAGFMFTPGALCVFFHDGPFAYNGLLAWYMPVTVFSAWIPINIWLFLMAIRAQESEGHLTSQGSAPRDVEDLARELDQMRRELTRVTAGADSREA